MADRVLIEFDAEIGDGLLSAVDFLIKIGVIDAAVGEQFKKTNAVFKEREKAVQSLKTTQAGASAEVDKTTKSYDALNKSVLNISNTVADGTLFDASNEALKISSAQLKEMGLTFDEFVEKLKSGGEKAEQGTLSLRTQLRKMKEDLTLLEAQGKENTKEFEQMAIKAAKLEDQIGDTQTRIRNMADDSRGLKTVLEGLSGVAAGFEVMQGAIALAGDENKQLQETLVKLNAVMAVANGLTQLNTILQKESFLSTAVSTALRRAQTVSTQLETVAESENIVVRYAAIAAQKALNAVMAASPAGILLVAITAIAGALVYFTSSTDDATEAQVRLNEELEFTKKALEDEEKILKTNSDAKTKTLQAELQVLKARGANADQVRSKEQEIEEQQKRSASSAKSIFEEEIKQISTRKEKIEELKDRVAILNQLESKDENIKKRIDALEAEKTHLQGLVDFAQGIVDAEQEASTNLIVGNAAREKAVNDERLANAKAIADRILIEAKAGTQKELAAKIDVINKQRDIELDAAKGKADQIALVNAKADEEIKKSRSTFIQQRLEEEKQADEILLQQTTKDSQEELDLKIKIIREEARIEREEFGKTDIEKENIRKQSEQRIIEARREFAQKQTQSEINIVKNDAERRVAIARAGSEQELQAKKESIDAQLALDVAAINTGGELTEAQWAEINRLQAQALRSQEDLDKDFKGRELARAKSHADLLVDIEKRKLTNELNDPKNSPQDKTDITKQLILTERKTIDNDSQDLAAKFALDLITYQEFIDGKLDIDQKYADNKAKLDQVMAEEEKQLHEQVKNFLINTGQAALNTLFQSQQDSRTATLNDQIESIETEKETLLKNKRLTEKEKEEIEKESRERTARIKLSAWEADRDAAAEQAAINGLLAITKTFAEYGFTPAAAIAVAGLVVETGLQVAAIQSKTPPKFFKGTDYVTRDGHPVGIDTVPAMLTEGEGVDPVDINRDYSPALKSIRRRKVSSEVVNKLITEIPADTSISTVTKIINLIKGGKDTEEKWYTEKDVLESKKVRESEIRQQEINERKIAETKSQSSESISNILNSEKVQQDSSESKSTSAFQKEVSRIEKFRDQVVTRILNSISSSENINSSSNNNNRQELSYTLHIPSMVDSSPEIVKFTDKDFEELTSITNNGVHIDYEKLSDMIAKKMSEEMAEHIDDVSYRNRQDLKSGIPVSNLGPVVKAITELNQRDPYRS